MVRTDHRLKTEGGNKNPFIANNIESKTRVRRDNELKF